MNADEAERVASDLRDICKDGPYDTDPDHPIPATAVEAVGEEHTVGERTWTYRKVEVDLYKECVTWPRNMALHDPDADVGVRPPIALLDYAVRMGLKVSIAFVGDEHGSISQHRRARVTLTCKDGELGEPDDAREAVDAVTYQPRRDDEADA